MQQATPFAFRGKPVLYVHPSLVDGRARITPKGFKVERGAAGERICGKLFRAAHVRLADAVLDAESGFGFVTREGKRRYAAYL